MNAEYGMMNEPGRHHPFNIHHSSLAGDVD
jgi:hypothetical protein